MPPIVAVAVAVGAGAGALGAFTALSIGGSFVLGGAVVFGGLALASSLLAPTPPSFGGLAADTRRTVRAAVSNARWVLGRARVGGVLAYYIEPDDDDRDVHFMLVLCEGPIDGIEKVWIDGVEMPWEGGGRSSADGDVMAENTATTPPDGHEYNGFATFRAYANGAAAAQALRDVDGSQWTAAHELSGKACVHVHLRQSDYGNETDERVWHSLPNIEFLVRGLRFTWPGQAVARWTDNAAAIRYWWLTQRRDVPESAIDAADFVLAHTYCGSLVNNVLSPEYYTDGYPRQSPRYTINGVIRSGDDHDRAESEMDFAWAGYVVEVAGTHHFRPGRDDNRGRQIETISSDEIISVLTVNPAPALSDRINAMTMRLIQSNVHGYTEAALPEFADPEGQTRDGGRLPKDMGTRPYVCCPVAGGRLMAILTRRVRAQKRYSIRITPGHDLERLAILPSDIVMLSDPAIAADPVRCVVLSRRINDDWSIDLTLEHQADGTHADTTVLPPLRGAAYSRTGVLDRPNAPMNLAATATVTVTDDGAAQSIVKVTFDATPHETVIRIDGPSEHAVSLFGANLTITGNAETVRVPFPGTYTGTAQHVNNLGVHSTAQSVTVVVSWADVPIGGQVWRSGSGDPDDSLGNDDDFYLDTASSNIWQKQDGSWVKISNLDAADGSQWLTGTDAPDDNDGEDGDWYLRTGTGAQAGEIFRKVSGSWVKQFDIGGGTWLGGAAEPGGSLGKVGDFYFRTSNGYVYEKTGEATWTFRRDITGPAGINGSVWHSVSGTPSDAIGADGDFALDVNSSKAYRKVNGSWVEQVDFAGADGDRWYTGSSAPASSLGNNGDWYFRTGSGDTAGEVWRKASGRWSKQVDIDQGADGATWYSGSGVPSSSLGAVGDFYFRTSNGYVYEHVP